MQGAILVKFYGIWLFMHGIRVAANVENVGISKLGTLRFPDAPHQARAPSFPHLTSHDGGKTRMDAYLTR